jgi:hypothetical protein
MRAGVISMQRGGQIKAGVHYVKKYDMITGAMNTQMDHPYHVIITPR